MSATRPAPLEAQRDRIVSGVAAGGGLRWAAAELPGVVEEARGRHDLSPVAASALGRAMAGAALLWELSLATWERLVVEVRGDGPLGKVVAEIDAAGNLRGLVGEPRVATAPAHGDALKIGAAVGRGFLRVRRESSTASYDSQVELVTGEIGLDLAHYLEQSEQTQSAVLVGVLTRPQGIAAAGGLIVEALPGAPASLVERLEANIAGLAGVSRLLERGGGEALAQAVLADLDPEPRLSRPLRFACRCDRSTLLDRLAVLSADERRELADDTGVIVAECAFCARRYRYRAAELAPQ